MTNYLDKYRTEFTRVREESRHLLSHLGVIRDHFREVEKMMVEMGLGIYAWVAIPDEDGVILGYLLFDSLIAAGERQGPGHLSICSDLVPFDMNDPVVDPRMALFRIESAPYESLVYAYHVLPDLVETYLKTVLHNCGLASNLEGEINGFRDRVLNLLGSS